MEKTVRGSQDDVKEAGREAEKRKLTESAREG